MSSRLGKHSLNKVTARQYEGASASQKVRAAEWSGTLAWNNQNHPSSPSSSSWNAYQVDIDYNKPWFEKDEGGEWKCLLCGAYATDGHIYSDKHQTRSKNPEWYGYPSSGALGSTDELCGTCDKNGGYYSELYNKPWIERKDGEYFCNLCGNWATEGHLMSDKHTKRASAPHYYGYDAQPQDDGLPHGWAAFWSEEHKCHYYHHEESGDTTWDRPGGAAVSESAIVPYYNPPEYDVPWLERKEHGNYYCNLCGNWATDGHLASEKHRKRAECPEWYGFSAGGSLGTSHSTAATQFTPMASTSSPAKAPSVPPPWVSYWSQEHQAYYFHNPDTEETRWEKPVEHVN